ncbi:MAG: hypothetical protein WBQ23_03515 [Bacteroidota bacterium]
MKLLPVFIVVLLVAGCLLACSSRDEEVARYAKLHPPPFELRATDSSIMAKYMWKDTLADYYLAVTLEDADGGISYITPRRGIVFPPAIPQEEVEFLFADLGIRKKNVTYGIWFLSDTHARDEYGYKWMFADGKFDPVLFKNSQKL